MKNSVKESFVILGIAFFLYLLNAVFYGILFFRLGLVKGWQEKKLARVAFGGFFCVIFTYLGVSYLLSGLHSYA